MRPLRLFLLMLIAVLLPVRGALAAAGPCGQGAGGVPMAASAGLAGPATDSRGRDHADGPGHDHGHGHGDDHHHGHGHSHGSGPMHPLHGAADAVDAGGPAVHPLSGAAAPDPSDGGPSGPAADTGSHHGHGCQASACCLMPLGATPPVTVVERLTNPLRFPPQRAAVPDFESDGPERPPRRG